MGSFGGADFVRWRELVEYSGSFVAFWDVWLEIERFFLVSWRGGGMFKK